MHAFILVMLAFAGLSGCIERPTGVTQLPLEFGMSGDAVSVRARIEGRGPMRQGQTLPARIAVTNVSDGPVILAHVTVNVGNTSASSDWRVRVYGSVTYDESADLYRLNEMAQMEAGMADWSNGLLLPGETTECTVPVEVLEAGGVECGCGLAYYSGTFEDMAPTIYLEREREGFNVTYGPSMPEELQALAATGGAFETSRLVIHRSNSAPLMAKTEATLRVAPAALSPEEAMTRAQLHTERYAYSEKEGGWVLEAPDAVVVVTLTAVKRYPGCTLPVWQFIERSPEEVYFWYLVDDKGLHDIFREMGYVVQEHKGSHAYVRSADTLSLIEKAHQTGYISQMSDFQFTPCISFEPITTKTSD